MDQLALQAIYEGDDDEIRRILADVCACTEMGFAAVARVTEDRWIACQVLDRIGFGLLPGGELEIQKTICNEIRQHARAVVFDDAISDPTWETHPVPIFYGFRSYASFPVFLSDGTFFDTLCAIDPEPRQLSSEAVLASIRSSAARVGEILSARRCEDSRISCAGGVSNER
jgi:GAF domain-containing protein